MYYLWLYRALRVVDAACPWLGWILATVVITAAVVDGSPPHPAVLQVILSVLLVAVLAARVIVPLLIDRERARLDRLIAARRDKALLDRPDLTKSLEQMRRGEGKPYRPHT